MNDDDHESLFGFLTFHVVCFYELGKQSWVISWVINSAISWILLYDCSWSGLTEGILEKGFESSPYLRDVNLTLTLWEKFDFVEQPLYIIQPS